MQIFKEEKMNCENEKTKNKIIVLEERRKNRKPAKRKRMEQYFWINLDKRK